MTGFLGWKLSLWYVPAWLAVQQSKAVFFLTLYDSINDMKYFLNCLHHTSSVPQPFLLLMAANLALTGFLGWKWSLWSVPDWLAVQRSKYVFFLALHDIINDMKHFWTVLITSSVPQPFLLLIAANLALTGFLGWKWSLLSVPAWLEVDRKKSCLLPNLIWKYQWYEILTKLSASHLIRATAIFVVDCCQFGPSWIFGLKMELMACANLVGGKIEQSCRFPDLIW